MAKSLLVLKFGGTSLADIDCIDNVSNIVQDLQSKGKALVVVVSAMAGVTNSLKNLSNHPKLANHEQALASLLSTGEMQSASLLAMSLSKKKIKSQALSGWQVPILTEDDFCDSSIRNVDSNFLLSLVAKNVVPVVCGFQGVNRNNMLTILSRGGSDTSAVAIAAVLQAEACYIYTDVNGVFSADPRVVPFAKLNKYLDYNVMQQLSVGAKVLHAQAAFLASEHGIITKIKSSFEKNQNLCTKVLSKNSKSLHITKIFGITKVRLCMIQFCLNEICLSDLLYKLTSCEVFEFFNNNGEVSVWFELTEIAKIEAILSSINATILSRSNDCHVTMIGSNLKSVPDLVYSIAENLSKIVDIKKLQLEDTKVSCIVAEEYGDTVLQRLHAKFVSDI